MEQNYRYHLDCIRYLQVTWIEHNEVDYSYVPNMFIKLVSSGFAFRAKRWITTLQRQCERLKLLMDDDSGNFLIFSQLNILL